MTSASIHRPELIFGIKPFIVELAVAGRRDLGWRSTAPDLKDGDVVEIEITSIGTLRNRFMKETAPGSPNV